MTLDWQTVPEWVFQGLTHATVLALITWLLSATLLRRCRPAVHAALWTVVLIKFLLPPVFPGDLAMSGWLSQSTRWLLAPTSAVQAAPTVVLSDAAGASIGSSDPSGIWLFGWLVLAGYVAVLGLIVFRAAIRGWRLRQGVNSLPEPPRPVLREVEALARQLGLARPPRVVTTDEAISPFVFGFLKPTLVLPDLVFERVELPAHRALIVHELAHIRRGDLLVRRLQNMARLLLFFWPPVWWVCRRIEGFSEMACDQWAVKLTRVSPHLYARSLLNVVKAIDASPARRRELATAPAFAQRGRLMEKRFEMILKKNPIDSPRLSWLTLLLLAGWASFAWAGGASSQETQEGEKKKVRVYQKAPKAEGRHQKDMAAHIAEVDTDGDGNVSKEEAMAFKMKREEFRNQRLLERFPEADTDRDGSLTGEELREFKRARQEQAILEQHPDADLDSDGYLSEIELKAFSDKRRQERITRILESHPDTDLDGDGNLDKNELREIRVKTLRKRAHSGEAVVEFSPEHTETTEHDVRLNKKVEGEDANVFVVRKEHPEGELHEGDHTTVELPEGHRTVFIRSDDGQKAIVEILAEGDDLNLEGGEARKLLVKIKEMHGEEGDMMFFDGDASELEWNSDENHFIVQDLLGEMELEFFSEDDLKMVEVKLEALHEGDHVWVSKEEAGSAEDRRTRLLKTNPEADLDHDGQISTEEAQAFAAKIQSETKKAKKGKKKN